MVVHRGEKLVGLRTRLGPNGLLDESEQALDAPRVRPAGQSYSSDT